MPFGQRIERHLCLEGQHHVELSGMRLAEHSAAFRRGTVQEIEQRAVLALWLTPRGHAERDRDAGVNGKPPEPVEVFVSLGLVAADVFAGEFKDASTEVTHHPDKRGYF